MYLWTLLLVPWCFHQVWRTSARLFLSIFPLTDFAPHSDNVVIVLMYSGLTERYSPGLLSRSQFSLSDEADTNSLADRRNILNSLFDCSWFIFISVGISSSDWMNKIQNKPYTFSHLNVGKMCHVLRNLIISHSFFSTSLLAIRENFSYLEQNTNLLLLRWKENCCSVPVCSFDWTRRVSLGNLSLRTRIPNFYFEFGFRHHFCETCS